MTITVHPEQARIGYVLVFLTLEQYLRWQINPVQYQGELRIEHLKEGTYHPTEEFISGQRKYAVTTYDNIQHHKSGGYQVWAVPNEYYEKQ